MQIRFHAAAMFTAGALALAATASAQTPPPRPVPFPTAGSAAANAAPAEQPPTDEALGAPVYPAAVFLETIDAGRGQQYHLYGTDAPYNDIVQYYKTTLRNNGRTIFQAPAMQQFELGRFDDDTMAYPPSVVVKDYAWNGSEGYLHVDGTTTRRFKTVIQIVPPPGR
jgi:hypothetical protein